MSNMSKFISKLSLVFLLNCFTQYLHAQNGQFLKVDTTKYIIWNEGQPITWNDYTLLSDSESRSGSYALTAVTHSIRGGIENGKPNFQVFVLFKKEDSWTSDNTDMALFAHEKLHFDIAELYGRKLRKQIEAMGNQGETDLKVYRKRIKLLLNEFNRKSQEYDRETKHGESVSKQIEWKEFILFELNRLNEYM